MEGSEWTRRKNGRLEKCSCFEVDGNAGFSCIFTDEDTFLLIADSNQIHKISILDKSVYRDDFVNVPTYGIVALAIDQENNNLYFSDVSFDRTGRVSIPCKILPNSDLPWVTPRKSAYKLSV